MEQKKALVRRFFEQTDREERLPAALCGPGFVARIAGYPPMNLEGFQQFISVFYTSFSGFVHDIEHLLEEGDVVAFRAVARATHTGEFMGVRATGKPISVPIIGMARIVDGRVAEWWNSPDQLGLLQQIG